MNDNKVLALLGHDANKSIEKKLQELGFNVLRLPHDERLPLPIRSHADTLIFSVNDQVFCSAEYHELAKPIFDALEGYGYNIVKSDATVSNEYPHDIAFNCFYCNNALYGNFKHTASKIKEFARQSGYSCVPVKQGYAKCSTVALGNTAIISADSGITDAARAHGIAVLKIENSPAAVSLDGYDYGFIGGACGVFGDTVYFTGDVEKHPQGKDIIKFCNSLGFLVKALSNDKICDVGGILFFSKLS